MTELDALVDEWDLRPDGPIIHGDRAVVLPVRTTDATAILKVSESADNAHLVLRRWGGNGAVRILRADPHRRALLLERLRTQTLAQLPDDAACAVIASLYRRIHASAMPQLPSMTTLLDVWAEDFAALPRSAPIPHRLVEQAITLSRDLSTEPAETVLHGDLHYGNVLAGDREPWLAIAPKPINGDPHYDLAPMLWTRWVADHIRDNVRRRFYTLVDAAGFDEDKARAWVLVRVLREAARTLNQADTSMLTRYISVAKAVQD